MDYQHMLNFVNDYLERHNAIRSKKPKFCFRNRFEHTKRVYKWANILLSDYPNCNKDVVLVSAIFHDVGYAFGQKDHAIKSAEIFMEYAKDNNLDLELSQMIYENILVHSNKHLLDDKDISPELIILLEADLLDEEGALGIAFDLLSEGFKCPDNYQSGIESITMHSAHIFNQNFMVSPTAKKIWSKKQELVRMFLEEYKNDLFIEEDN